MLIMSKGNLFTLLFCALFSVSPALQAQFYAPDTEYHDPVQRVFPVEAARAFGWFGNRQTNTIHQVVYNVSTKPDGTTAWSIQWLARDGKPVKQVKVAYPKKLLESGPDFYREVVRQVAEAGWEGLTPQKADFVREKFWQGADAATTARESSIQKAFKLAPANVADAKQDWMPELAGLLIHSGRLAAADRLTIDDLLIARGAVWLAFSERAAAEKLDALWPPVLGLANRYKAAAALWSKNYPARPEMDSPSLQAWNIAFRDPSSRAIYLFALNAKNWNAAVPLMVFDWRITESNDLISELLPYLAGTQANLEELHNLAPLFGQAGSVGLGHLSGGVYPVLARSAWLKLLEDHSVSEPALVTKYKPLLAAAANAVKKPDGKLPDPSLRGLKECSPLLQFAHKEGQGILAPVAVASTRDLLNYGWEMTGIQMSGRHRFVTYRWGIKDLGRTIYDQSVAAADGWMPFFWAGSKTGIGDYNEALTRVQMVDGHYDRAGFARHPFGVGLSDKDACLMWLKRSWLRPRDLEWQARTLWDHDIKFVAEHLQITADLSGPAGAAEVLGYLVEIGKKHLEPQPALLALKTNLVAQIPQPSAITIRCLYDTQFSQLPNAERAVEMEKLYWKNPDSIPPDRVFRNYVVSGQFKNARRFYEQCRENLTEPITFSNTMGTKAFVLAFLTDDKEMRRWALEDSRSGSYNDMIMGIWEATIHDNEKALEGRLDEMVERYESEKPPTAAGKLLRGFVPLLPALKDPKHPKREEALSYFGKQADGVIFRWILIQKYKVPTEDAIRFLGGRENDPLRSCLIACLEGVNWKALEALNKLTGQDSSISYNDVLATVVYRQKTGHTDDKLTPNLKPNDSGSLRKLVITKLKEQGRWPNFR